MTNKIKFGDLMAFVRAGWSPADVKEVMAMSDDSAADEQAASVSENEIQQPATENAPETTGQTEDVPDYKTMYEETLKQKEALQADLIKAQSVNTSVNAQPDQPKVTGQEAVNNIFREVIF